jgi:hypothetical protein
MRPAYAFQGHFTRQLLVLGHKDLAQPPLACNRSGR